MKNNKKFEEESLESKVYEGGKEYYQYIRELKKGNPLESEHYAVAFITV